MGSGRRPASGGGAGLILELSGKEGELIEKPLPADDPRQRRPDITRAREVLKRTLEWFAERSRRLEKSKVS